MRAAESFTTLEAGGSFDLLSAAVLIMLIMVIMLKPFAIEIRGKVGFV